MKGVSQKSYKMLSESAEEYSQSWTDDLPKCTYTGIGIADRALYRSHVDLPSPKSWDRHFFCRVDENCHLYAIFSGHNGSTISELAVQRIAAEILLGQLNGRNSEEEIKEVLRQAFIAVEKCYQESIDGILAEKAMLQCQITEKPISRERNLRNILNIDNELTKGSSAALCLIYNSKLYVCNVGTCRVLLCKNDENKAPRFVQFSVDHNLSNEDEILRLQQIGLDVQKLRQFPIDSTRCLGYYIGKGGYKGCDYFAEANGEPIIAQPEIVGGIPIDDSFQFLLLMSSGMCKALQDIYASDTVKENKEVVRIAAKEFDTQSNLTDIAQSVVNKIMNSHQEMYRTLNNIGVRREGVTLILRNFNTQIKTLQPKKPNQVTFNTYVEEVPTLAENTYSDINVMDNNTNQYTDTTTTVSSFDQKPNEIFDKNRKIVPYVNFSSFYENVEKAKREGTLPSDIDFD